MPRYAALLERADDPRERAYAYTGHFDVALLREDLETFRVSAVHALRPHAECENHGELAYAVNAVAAASSPHAAPERGVVALRPRRAGQ